MAGVAQRSGAQDDAVHLQHPVPLLGLPVKRFVYFSKRTLPPKKKANGHYWTSRRKEPSDVPHKLPFKRNPETSPHMAKLLEAFQTLQHPVPL